MSSWKAEEHNMTLTSTSTGSRVTHALSAVLVVCCTGFLAMTPAATATGVRLLTNALIMTGTGTPVPSPGYVETVINDFIAPTVPDSYDPVAVTTPERLLGINSSVDGVTALETAMAENNCSQGGQSCVIFGYSQSTVITMVEKARLQQRLAAGEEIPNVTFIGIGVGNRPNGGIAERLSGITIPVADFTFNGPSPAGNSIPTIDIARQYDGLADTPEFLLNPVADLNAVLGVIFIHGMYTDVVSLDPASPHYVGNLTPEKLGDTTYYWIPTPDLPMLAPLRLLGVPEPVLDIVQPFLKVLVEAGYDRSIPFSTPTPAQMIPVIDPVTFSIELASATLEGINNAAKIIGAELPGYAALQQRLAAAQAWSATTIGVPYRNVVTTINDAFNPFQIFAQIEGPVARQFDKVLDDVGITQLLGKIVNPPVPARSASMKSKVQSAVVSSNSATDLATAAGAEQSNPRLHSLFGARSNTATKAGALSTAGNRSSQSRSSIEARNLKPHKSLDARTAHPRPSHNAH
jgi:PE-PPE domain